MQSTSHNANPQESFLKLQTLYRAVQEENGEGEGHEIRCKKLHFDPMNIKIKRM